MIRDLSDDQILVLAELAIHHGMYEHAGCPWKYDIYYRIAGELMEEVLDRGYSPKWAKILTDEFVQAQLERGSP